MEKTMTEMAMVDILGNPSNDTVSHSNHTNSTTVMMVHPYTPIIIPGISVETLSKNTQKTETKISPKEPESPSKNSNSEEEKPFGFVGMPYSHNQLILIENLERKLEKYKEDVKEMVDKEDRAVIENLNVLWKKEDQIRREEEKNRKEWEKTKKEEEDKMKNENSKKKDKIGDQWKRKLFGNKGQKLSGDSPNKAQGDPAEAWVTGDGARSVTQKEELKPSDEGFRRKVRNLSGKLRTKEKLNEEDVAECSASLSMIAPTINARMGL